ncbi:MAG: molybdopterin-dependent oxidoreductase [Thermoleophilia bacterium]|nr:molybdopterin-dependent oxidoreductase [Thermoleophilia bacterium]
MSAAETTGVQMVTLSINGQEVQARAGQTILEAAQANGVEIPTLCHDPRLEPYGACRMCLVEVEGARGPMASCGTTVREGMKVQTHSEKIVKLRKFVLELLLTNHPLDCPVCEAAGDCRLQDYAYEYLVDMVPWGWRAPVAGDPGTHPNIAHFGARCILCGRCVRICREVMSIGCWGYLNRGYDSEVDTPYRLPLQEVDCVSCGQCVSTCPVGAIVGQRTPGGAREWQTEKTVTTCSYCADGCRLVLHSYRGKVVRVASEAGKGLNQGNLCVKGRFGIGYAASPDRLTKPLVRDASGTLVDSTWEEALKVVAEKLSAAKQSLGGQTVATVCGTHCTNEAAYLLQKLMRTVVGSNNVDAIDHGEQAAAEEALTAAFGVSAATNWRKDLREAEAILVIGSNLTESHPVLALEVIRAVRLGKTVIVVDPVTTDLAAKAGYHLAVRPGTDLAVLRAMMKHVLALGLADADFVAARTDGFQEFEKSLGGVDAAVEAATAGVDADLVRAAAAAFGRAGSAAVLVGTGVSQGPKSKAVMAALADFVLLTGNVGRPGAGIFPLRSGANSQGLADMGVRPDRLPGGAPVDDAAALARLEAAWGTSISALPQGVSATGLAAAMQSGDIQVLYVMGADPALAMPGESAVLKGLEQVGFVVVQDSFLTETARYADVVLPAAVASEDEGTFTNGERFVQRVRAAVPALGDSLPDWKIVQMLANRLGADWAYSAPADVMGEIADVTPAYKGVTYGKIEEGGLQWPCSSVECSGAPILCAEGFAGGKADFVPVEGGGAEIVTGAEFPFILITGSVREHHGTGERTRRSPGVTGLVAEAQLRVNPADAEKLGVAEGDAVRVAGQDGSAVEAAVCLTKRMPQGMVFLPGFSPAVPVNRLLGPERSAAAAVRLERLG